MLLMVLTLAAFSLYALSPEYSATALSGFLSTSYGISATFNFAVLGSVVWFLLLIFSLRYFQVSVSIERQYDYIHQLEDKLNAKCGEEIITREGKSYLSNYPKFSDWIWMLYTVFFPLILLVITATKIVSEWRAVGFDCDLFVLLDTIFFGLLAVTIILYMVKIHLANQSKQEETDVVEHD